MTTRRVRRRKPNVRPAKTGGDKLTGAKRKLTNIAKSLDTLIHERAELDRQIAAEQKEAQDIMDAHSIASHETKYGNHEYVRARTKASSEVNKAKFLQQLRKKLGAEKGTERALELASFKVGEVRKEFASKEADRVIDVEPAPPGEVRYQFISVEQAAKQKK